MTGAGTERWAPSVPAGLVRSTTRKQGVLMAQPAWKTSCGGCDEAHAWGASHSASRSQETESAGEGCAGLAARVRLALTP